MKRRADLDRAVIALLFASLLIGAAQVCLLPPWEGFDETAHYSYIQQLAETGVWPRRGGPLSSAVEQYGKVAPMPYAAYPPYTAADGDWTYHEFFLASADQLEAGRRLVQAPAKASWKPGTMPNWEAQHPPLYYALLVPFYWLSRGWSLLQALLLLRIVSYFLAWLGLCITAAAARPPESDLSPESAFLYVAPALWPFVFPMWFPEMARLGNDSLVTLLVAAAWLAFRRLLSRNRISNYCAVALLCGLGLLTKATFLPLVAVILGYLVVRCWLAREPEDRRASRSGLLLFCALAAASSGWWYLSKYRETGNLLGAHDIANLAGSGGLLPALAKPGFFHAFLEGVFQVGISFLWNGTWSFVEPPWPALLPLLASAALFGLAHLVFLRQITLAQTLRRKTLLSAAWLPLLTLAVFALGLVFSVWVFIAAYGVAGTPGWYLHSFAPLFSIILGAGILTAMRSLMLRIPVIVLLLYPLLFLPGVAVLEALTYAGCGEKTAFWSLAGSLHFGPSPAPCPGAFSMFRNLAVLASPEAAAVCFALGLAAGIVGALLLLRSGVFSARSLTVSQFPLQVAS